MIYLKKNLKLLILLSVFVIMCIVSIIRAQNQAREEIASTCSNLQFELEQTILGNLADSLQGKAEFAYDFTGHTVIFAQNENTPLPLASLTKIMTARLALEHFSLNNKIHITESDLEPLGDYGFTAGDVFSFKDMLKSMLIFSSNDAATAVAHNVAPLNQFITRMNTEARTLGFKTLGYASVSGLDTESETSSAQGSAKDTLFLFEKSFLEYPEAYGVSTHKKDFIVSTKGSVIELHNTNEALDQLPLLVASKTGYTLVAGGNLAILWKDPYEHLLGAITLGSSKYSRFTDIVSLYTRANILRNALETEPEACIQS